jgi:DNA primase
MTYDDEMLQEINASVDLLEYVSQSIEMEKRGRDYFGHCPLHVDNTPSFSITPSKNSYYCFSCGRSGGIIGYLMDYEHLRFDDAVDKAAKLGNMDLSKMCKSQTMTFLKKTKNLMREKEQVVHEVLSANELSKYSHEDVTEWIDEGILQEVMDLFEVRINDRDNRIVYPVYDINGNLINIKGRTRYKNYKELRIPKYINYYPIGTMDYFQGLNITLPFIKDQNEMIIFESVKSVMKAYGWGYKNCASAEKHTITDEQLKLLVRLRVNIVFAFDSDISYSDKDIKKTIDVLKRITNVYVIYDRKGLLGGKDAKNAPVDLSREIWEQLYFNKTKVT